MTLKYLITGATGGLGKEVLAYFEANRPSSEYAAASSRESNRKQFEERGIAFRHVDYDDPRTLDAAFPGVENLSPPDLFSFHLQGLTGQVWYTSLAFGGLKSDSKAAIQQAHLQTEDHSRSGLTFTSIREGVYADAFPLFINWYPDTTTVSLPADGRCAFTLRKELGEANARLMLQGGHENEIVLLTAGETISFAETVDVINETTGRNVRFQIVSPEEYVRLSAANDQGGKPAEFFQALVSWYDSVAQGEISHTHPLMKEVLGREPTTPREAIRGFLLENRDSRVFRCDLEG